MQNSIVAAFSPKKKEICFACFYASFNYNFTFKCALSSKCQGKWVWSFIIMFLFCMVPQHFDIPCKHTHVKFGYVEKNLIRNKAFKAFLKVTIGNWS